MTEWHPDAYTEIVDYGRSNPPTSGKRAGHIYEFAERLTNSRSSSLPRLGSGKPEIRWWDFMNMTTYFHIDDRTIRVLLIGQTNTPQQRAQCDGDARLRC